jgi:hypothetical protein
MPAPSNDFDAVQKFITEAEEAFQFFAEQTAQLGVNNKCTPDMVELLKLYHDVLIKLNDIKRHKPFATPIANVFGS